MITLARTLTPWVAIGLGLALADNSWAHPEGPAFAYPLSPFDLGLINGLVWFSLVAIGVVGCAVLFAWTRCREISGTGESASIAVLNVITRSFPDPVLVTNVTGRIIATSPAAEDFFHYSEQELLSMEVEQLMPADFAASHRKMREDFMTRDPGLAMNNEVSCLLKAGGNALAETRVQTFRMDNKICGLVSLRDISQFKNREAELKTLSERDALTGLANRRLFDNEFLAEWNRSRRTEQKLALLLIDVDAFKQFNDCYGHQQGDQTLTRVASALSTALQRSVDRIYRYGGEEFVCMLPGLSAPEATKVAERLRAVVEQLQIQHQGSSVSQWVTVSVGVASQVPLVGVECKSLLGQADQALYQSKLSGRNRVTTYITQ